jgi:N-acetylglutamate synthase-like GNAT family acetyltransferase
MPGVTIRTATAADAVEILHLLTAMHAEAPIGHAPIDPARAFDFIHRVIGEGAVFIAEKEGLPVGSLGCMPGMDWWSSEVLLKDAWNYVRPEHRASRAGYLLFKAYTETARNMGLKRKSAVVNGENIDRKDKFFARFGMVPAGSIYVEGANHG